MKRIIILFFIISVLMHVPVYADVLIEPDDSFYKWHADECYSVNKYYTAQNNTPVYHSPNSWFQFDEAEKGSTFFIEWIYTESNGDQWGLYEGHTISYWVSMNDLIPLYSHDEFMTEHASEIIENEVTFYPEQTGWVILYEYPGSTWISDILDTDWIGEGSFTVRTIYIDSDGNQWGYMPYYMKHNGWFNLTHPVSSKEPVRCSPEIYVPEKEGLNILLAVFFVVLACTLTAFVSVFFLKKTQKSDK